MYVLKQLINIADRKQVARELSRLYPFMDYTDCLNLFDAVKKDINRLEATENPDYKDAIITVRKYDEACSERYVSELLITEGGFLLTPYFHLPWEELIGLEVDTETNTDITFLIAVIIYEMTYLGDTYNEVKRAIRLLDNLTCALSEED